MTLHEKIINIRVELQNSKLKKSGLNKHAGFSYYELSDFLPRLNELMLQFKVNDELQIHNERAVLLIHDAEDVEDKNPVSIEIPFSMFAVPMTKSGSPMMQQIQYLGALNTYCKRYLYLNAFGITDGEVVDSLDNKQMVKSLPIPNANQWKGILTKFENGDINLSQIQDNFLLNAIQLKELNNLI